MPVSWHPQSFDLWLRRAEAPAWWQSAVPAPSGRLCRFRVVSTTMSRRRSSRGLRRSVFPRLRRFSLFDSCSDIRRWRFLRKEKGKRIFREQNRGVNGHCRVDNTHINYSPNTIFMTSNRFQSTYNYGIWYLDWLSRLNNALHASYHNNVCLIKRFRPRGPH